MLGRMNDGMSRMRDRISGVLRCICRSVSLTLLLAVLGGDAADARANAVLTGAQRRLAGLHLLSDGASPVHGIGIAGENGFGHRPTAGSREDDGSRRSCFGGEDGGKACE